MARSDLFADKAAAVFDAYGTLFDVHSAVQRHAEEIGPDAVRLSEVWRGKQLEYSWVRGLMGRYASFWSLTEQALDYALAQHPSVDPRLRPTLLDAYRALDAYPEVPATLARLRESGIRTAIFSNGDPDMVKGAVASAKIGDRLDAVLSVDPARTFKTAPEAYRVVPDGLALCTDEIVFCSANRWDVAGACAFGLTTVWVNRRGLPDEYADLAPSLVVRALDEVL